MTIALRVVEDDGRPITDDYFDRTAYLQLHSGSLDLLTNRLIELGMGFPLTVEPFPHPIKAAREANLISRDDYEKLFDEDMEFRDPNLRASHHRHVRFTYSNKPGIATYKLQPTGDGWWVTFAECGTALAVWERAGKPEFLPDATFDFIAFLENAAAHDGFRAW